MLCIYILKTNSDELGLAKSEMGPAPEIYSDIIQSKLKCVDY